MKGIKKKSVGKNIYIKEQSKDPKTFLRIKYFGIHLSNHSAI